MDSGFKAKKVPYDLTLIESAFDQMADLPMEVGMLCNRVLVVLQYDPWLLCKESIPGRPANEFVVGLRDILNGTNLAIRVVVNRTTRTVLVVEILFPVELHFA